MHHLITALLFLQVTFVFLPHVAAAELHSGFFENLILAVDPSGGIIGRYQESQGEVISKNCSFFMLGKARYGKANIITWSDRVLPGVLTAVKDGVELKVADGREHAGCGLVLLPQISEGIPLDMVRPTKWVDLRVVTTETATLHSGPATSYPSIATFTKGTTVGVTAKKDGWLRIESTQLQERQEGWMREGDTTKPKPPAHNYP